VGVFLSVAGAEGNLLQKLGHAFAQFGPAVH
jgi:hypothetical protein